MQKDEIKAVYIKQGLNDFTFWTMIGFLMMFSFGISLLMGDPFSCSKVGLEIGLEGCELDRFREVFFGCLLIFGGLFIFCLSIHRLVNLYKDYSRAVQN